MAKKYRIMTVDNEPDTVELVKQILEKEGYDVITALSGKECLEKLTKHNVDLILLDIMMPDISGWDTYEQIKTMDKRAGLKVAFLSILECSPARREQLKKEGVADYITKPFAPDELVKRVKAILAK